MDVVPTDLTAAEARVLGCLIEKEATTPDNYPLTLNSLRNACNQTTSRDPVVSYDDRDVERALQSLRERGITRTVHSTSNRATKYRHVVPDELGLDPAETALLSVLLLRGPQTVGELKGRTERQHRFETIDEVAAVLDALAARGFAVHLDRQPGQKDARWMHLLAGAPEVVPASGPVTVGASPASPTPDDPYATTAEFYDLLATAHWEAFGLQLLDLLADVDTAAGPIVDIGAGTGIGLPYLAAAANDASIYAVEPSASMRVALHARLADDDSLRETTTVDPRPFSAAALPAQACALVASAVLGHFTDAERDRLWRYIATALPRGAPAVVEILPPGRAIEVPPTRYRSLQVGGFTYEGWQRGTPVDERTMSWTMTYKVLDGDDEISASEVTSLWRCFTADDIRDEIVAHRLWLTEHDDAVVIRS